MRPYGPSGVLKQLQNDSDDSEQSESEFYYPTGDFTLLSDEGKSADFPSLSTIYTDDDQKTSEDICEIQMFIERQRPENIPAKVLNILVSKCFMNKRKENCRVYEPSSLSDFQRILQ